jgi:LPS-assembly protein
MLATAVGLLLVSGSVLGQSDGGTATSGDSQAAAQQCRAPGSIPPRGRVARSGPLPMDIQARDMQAPAGAPMRFEDDVLLVYGDQQLRTDELIYDPETGQVELPGWLEYTDAVIRMRADSAAYNTETSAGRFQQVDYYIAGAEGAGHAGEIEMLGPERARVEVFDFTTCDVDDPDWQLMAGEVDLDFESGVGTARNARLEFKGVPLLYSPWLSFPLDNRRKTGFLYPQLGASSDNGIDAAVPWYWNIAPNMDATFTPRLLGNRGLSLGNEFRFLTRRQAGTVQLDYLANDREADRDRWLARARYAARLGDGWTGRVNFNRVSDADYFFDLGNELEDSVVQYLRSDLRVRGQGRYWAMTTTFDTFQVIDRNVVDDREPYNRLPRVEFDVDLPLPNGFTFRVDSEAVYFDRSNGVTGLRLDALPELSWRLVRPGGFFEPRVGLRATGYSLDNVDAGVDDAPGRIQPILSLDGGLVFERETAGGLLQTLEPRAFYLYVPGRSQDEFPVFDTRELTFGFAQLYQTNRYTGADRQSDANQLTLAVTTRFLDRDDGSSLLDASLGQIFYFDDPSVRLPGEPANDRELSATVGEVNWRPSDRFLVNAGLQWDPDDSELDVAAFGLRWKGNDARQIQLGYRFRRDRVDQFDIRFRYPLTAELNLISRVNYSLEEDEPLELLAGLEYESCCWALRTSVRRYVSDRDADQRTAFFLELHLKGLGSLGRRPYNLFTY